jgi:cobalt/nickel transport system permease protein
MNLQALDRYQKQESLIHNLDPRPKLVLAVVFIFSNALLPDAAWLAFGLSFALLVVFNLLAELGLAYTLKRSFIALPFALAAISIIFTLPGEPLVAFNIGSWELTVSDVGLLRFFSILIRSWLSVQVAILLAATTPFHALAHAMRHLSIPSILISIISFMYRYLYVLNEEVIRLLRARSARSAQAENGKKQPIWWRARVAGNMVGQLFIRSLERSDRVYAAMQARGFRGQFLTINPHQLTRRDWFSAALTLTLITLIQIIGRWPI